jgi:hypothetical protein
MRRLRPSALPALIAGLALASLHCGADNTMERSSAIETALEVGGPADAAGLSPYPIGNLSLARSVQIQGELDATAGIKIGGWGASAGQAFDLSVSTQTEGYATLVAYLPKKSVTEPGSDQVRVGIDPCFRYVDGNCLQCVTRGGVKPTVRFGLTNLKFTLLSSKQLGQGVSGSVSGPGADINGSITVSTGGRDRSKDLPVAAWALQSLEKSMLFDASPSSVPAGDGCFTNADYDKWIVVSPTTNVPTTVAAMTDKLMDKASAWGICYAAVDATVGPSERHKLEIEASASLRSAFLGKSTPASATSRII